jgi:hypothetical protein
MDFPNLPDASTLISGPVTVAIGMAPFVWALVWEINVKSAGLSLTVSGYYFADGRRVRCIVRLVPHFVKNGRASSNVRSHWTTTEILSDAFDMFELICNSCARQAPNNAQGQGYVTRFGQVRFAQVGLVCDQAYLTVGSGLWAACVKNTTTQRTSGRTMVR